MRFRHVLYPGFMVATAFLVGAGPLAGQAGAAMKATAPDAMCGDGAFVRELDWRGYKGAWIPAEQLTTRDYPLIEVSRYHPDCEPTEDQVRAAEEFVVASYLEAVDRGWLDYEQSKRDGYVPYKPHLPRDNHYINVEFANDSRILDPEYPEYLMYYDTPEGKKLVGFMYFVRSLEEQGPQFAGPLSVWHYHNSPEPGCIYQMQMFASKQGPDGYYCEKGELANYQSPEMIHVWFVDHPEGPFATTMRLAPEILEKGIRPDLIELADPSKRR